MNPVDLNALAERLEQLRAFLNGAEAIDGVWFGEDHPTIKGRFWWRSYVMGPLLTEAVSELRAAIAGATEDGWRDIAMAPRDGTEFVGWNGRVQAVYRWSAGGWRRKVPGRDPTHWRPTSAPPAAPEGQ